MSPEGSALVKELTLTFAAPPNWPSSGGKPLVLSVVNPDGQRAEWPIAFLPAASTSVAPSAIPPPVTSSSAIPSPAQPTPIGRARSARLVSERTSGRRYL
jgi:hypothetical protein